MMGNLRMGLGIFGGLVSSILLFKVWSSWFFFRGCLIEQIQDTYVEENQGEIFGGESVVQTLETFTLSQAKICDFSPPYFQT